MTIPPSELQMKRLKRASDSAIYDLYQSGLEWDLTEPIVIEDRKDLKSEQTWREKLEPYSHQITNLITFCRRLPVTLLADDVGLGKTISAGLVASELISRGRVSKILIVCPKLLMPQWEEELSTKFGINSKGVIGRDLGLFKLPDEAFAVITTYNSARLHFDKLAQKGFEMLVLDEAHKLRNLYGVDNPPQVALRFRQALADRLFKYVLMLTATPIQNRLWDLYSLVDLLTVARGHQNPLGSEGMFASKYILDARNNARQLRPEKRDEFRSIIYGYMSRVRRVDAKLFFPSREVQLHRVAPTPEEVEVLNLISKPIQQLNRLAQISILQALTSSPHALAAQLESMARNGTFPLQVAQEVRALVQKMKTIAKLQGLGALVDQLKHEQPDNWRMVVFTCRRETQTLIEALLGEKGVTCGLINGQSGPRNQHTIAMFKKNPPDIHVIVSTEAGAEGINLQVANVLVNFDLPWNPMIVEQRIGRIQRLASVHEKVCIFNVILQGTFEEYIVGRLMEKLQMASHAIGDIESLLEASGMDDDEEGPESFTEKIRELVIASLAGRDVEKATKLAEQSITDAKIELEKEEKNINAMLGGMDGAIDLGPRCPKLPESKKSMDVRSFVKCAFQSLGAKLFERSDDRYLVELDGRQELIRFNQEQGNSLEAGTLCAPGTPFFEKLVTRITSIGLHLVEDLDQDPTRETKILVNEWTNSFGGNFISMDIEEIKFCFLGAALVRVRITVAHDSYERLLKVDCSSQGNSQQAPNALNPIGSFLDDPNTFGLPLEYLRAKIMEDIGLVEFCRFYEERLIEEVKGAGEDKYKQKKIEDDFTPRIQMSLVGLKGNVHRQLKVQVKYRISEESNNIFFSSLLLLPHNHKILTQPDMGICELTAVKMPVDCLGKCEISKVYVVKSLLNRSEVSARLALPQYMVTCALSGKRVLSDEAEKSDITERLVSKALLKTSVVSGRKAEAEFFAQCDFTSDQVLKNELSTSELSGKRYRSDQQARSGISGKAGHRSEFVACSETGKLLLPNEAEFCEMTGKAVGPGMLEKCDITQKMVLPSELEKSAVSGEKALKKFFVVSSLSGIRLLEQEAIRSSVGKFCAPLEGKLCIWSDQICHPDDLRECDLTGLLFHFKYMRNIDKTSEVLWSLLNGSRRKSDKSEFWEIIVAQVSKHIGKASYRVDAAELSPSNKCIAICLEMRTWLGLKIRYAGTFYSIAENAVVGHIVLGKRENHIWNEEKMKV